MWFKQIVREETGCATYMVASSETGECAVFDPLWDTQPYLDQAERHDLTITHVIDSHAHADHVSGARRLAAATKALLCMPIRMDCTFEARRLKDGERIRLGEVDLEVVHAPGHRPEQIGLLVRDLGRGEEPWCLLSADFVMVGNVARPDLAQGGEEGAKILFQQSLPRLLELPDFVEVYPGHVAGSTCGRVTSGKCSTTVGYERRFNPSLQLKDLSAFVDHMVKDQPARPANMENIVAINQGKRPCSDELPSVAILSPAAAKQLTAIVIDTRSATSFGAGHVPGAFNVQVESSTFEQNVGWILPAGGTQGLLLVAENEEWLRRATSKLAFVGLDQRVRGAIDMAAWRAASEPVAQLERITVQELKRAVDAREIAVLDVRECGEVADGHIASALHMSFKQLGARLHELPLSPEKPVAVICAGGVRSTTGSSILLRNGFKHVRNVTGGMNAWRAAALPIVQGSVG